MGSAPPDRSAPIGYLGTAGRQPLLMPATTSAPGSWIPRLQPTQNITIVVPSPHATMGSHADPQRIGDYLASYAHISLDAITHKIDKDPETTTQGAITDPEGRLAQAEVAPWIGGRELLDEIFSCLYDFDSLPPEFPCRLHVDATGRELCMINSEAAVHLFDVDTLYKPAKWITEFALRQPSLRDAITAVLHRGGYNVDSSMAAHGGESTEGNIVFAPHSRTITVPDHALHGRKRKRATSSVSSELSPGSRERLPTDSEAIERNSRVEDEIQVAQNMSSPDPSPREARDSKSNVEEVKIKVKAGPGDYYCSFVPKPPRRQTSSLLIVGEAKAPHKLTRGLIQRALGEDVTIDTRQFIQDVRQDGAEPRPPDDVFIRGNPDSGYNSLDQRWLAAVATQIYSTLLSEGARYGYITTGESYILLRIRPNHPTTLDYLLLPRIRSPPERLSQPAHDRGPWLKWLAESPLARLSCFILLSFFTGSHLTDADFDQAHASRSSMIWRTPRDREQSYESKSFLSVASKDSDPDWTEAQDAPGRRTRAPTQLKRSRSETMTEDEDDACQYGTAKRRRLRTPSSSCMPSEEATMCMTPPAETMHINSVPFCTSSCISSLMHQTAGDPSCPNWSVHQQHPHCQKPPTSAADLLAMARTSVDLPHTRGPQSDVEESPRIWRSPTPNAIYTGQFGAVSAIFKVRIEPGGYVLVAKAARTYEQSVGLDTVHALKREDRVYKKLRAIQGKVIPVCVGLVDCSEDETNHNLGPGRFPAFLLLSWAGSSLLSQCTNSADEAWLARLRTDVEAQLKQIHGLGVLHQDVELPVVTGGSRGIGRAITIQFARKGLDKIAITYASNSEAAEATLAECRRLGVSKTIAIQAEVTYPQFGPLVVQQALQGLGTTTIDIHVNNACIGGMKYYRPVHETTADIFLHLMHGNVYSAMALTTECMAHFPAGGGRVINISSAASRLANPSPTVVHGAA
ncbi:hypothetical protein INS49_005056 [Diaporthe citri]|uniref:uncharacterized protein n=1 Tax=Diaporthe citri TaxID=83186 RepID=UPI001C827EA5|nr:uncharacterized protein INS49_005056 [Diaporthe citri]KAG6354085.1 hypothetical protein INS49_005056 [Diaporthe citri]